MGKWPVSIFYAIAVACDFKRLQSILVGVGFFNLSNNRDQLWAVSVVRNKKVKNLKVITTFYMYPFLHTNLQLKQFTTFISNLLSLNFLVMQFLKKTIVTNSSMVIHFPAFEKLQFYCRPELMHLWTHTRTMLDFQEYINLVVSACLEVAQQSVTSLAHMSVLPLHLECFYISQVSLKKRKPMKM